jgi:hypothetical protein
MADDVQTYQDQLAKLLQGQMAERPKPFLDPQMLALAEGFLTPGRTGNAFEAFGTAAGKLRTAQEQQQQQEQAESARKIQLAQLGLQMAYQKRKESAWDEFELAQGYKTPGEPPVGMPPTGAGMPPMGEMPPAGAGAPPMGGAQTSPVIIPPVSAPPSGGLPMAKPSQSLQGEPLPPLSPRGSVLTSGGLPGPNPVGMPSESPTMAQTEMGIQIAPPLNLPDERKLARLARLSGQDLPAYEKERIDRELKKRQTNQWGVFDSSTGRSYIPQTADMVDLRVGNGIDEVYNVPKELAIRYNNARMTGNSVAMSQLADQARGGGRAASTIGPDGQPLTAEQRAMNPMNRAPTVADVKAREAEVKLQQEMAQKEAEANFEARTKTIPNMKQVSREQIETATQLKDLLKNHPPAFGPLAKSGFLAAATNFVAGKIVSKDPNELNGIDDLVVQLTGKDADISARQNARALINNVLFTLRQKNAGQGAWSNAESSALAATGPGLGDTPEALLNKLEILRLNGIKQQRYLEDYKGWQKNPINKGKGWLNYSESDDYEIITDEFDDKLKSIFKGAAPATKPASGQVIQWTPR